MTPHSETPWKTEPNDNLVNHLIFAPEGDIEWVVAETVSNEPQDLANAAHICLCVNAHEELVKACRKLLYFHDNPLTPIQQLADPNFLRVIEETRFLLGGLPQ